MEILFVHIEREGGNACCGTMAIINDGQTSHLLWTVEYREREVRLEVFPCGPMDSQVLAQGRQRISDKLLSVLGGKTLVHGR